MDVAEILVREGLLREEELAHARKLGAGSGPALVRLGLVSETALADTYARSLGLPRLPDDAHALPGTLPLRFLQEALVLPVQNGGAEPALAMADPTDQFTLQAARLACSMQLSACVATVTQIRSGIEYLQGEDASPLADLAEAIEADDGSGDESVEHLRDLATEAPVVRLVNLLIDRAIANGASDVHIEPFEARLQVRYRIDGVLQPVDAPPGRSAAAVISRIKLMAKLDIAERRLPQDGRVQLRVQGRRIDLRVSTVPTLYGESLVLRILDQERLELTPAALGFGAAQTRAFEQVLARPHGIVLVTGPTGSGKTTTLYTALSKLNTPGRKLITIEDPVEYQLAGINQVQVRPGIGLGFAEALRSIVRQDPDVIMVGEMRDLETARIAVQSALTGHLVFSTLHTNDAGSAVTRLLDMGVAAYLLCSTLHCVISQRLVRKLCTACRVRDGDAYRAHGCDACADTGYAGRTSILEMLHLNAELRQLILARADAATIQTAAVRAGMRTMHAHGVERVGAGETSMDEVLRVTETD